MVLTRSVGVPSSPAQAEAIADPAAKSPTDSFSSAPLSPASPTSPASADVAAFASAPFSMSDSKDPFTIRDSKKRGPGRPIPRFTVDLSLPPAHRFDHIVPQFEREIANSNLTGLFDDLLNAFVGPKWSPTLHLMAGIALRRVYSSEETDELRGIATATKIPMHLLVAFNVLLDLLLGCTSGGVRVEAPAMGSNGPAVGSNESPKHLGSWISRMLHFRTLDWGMDPLRNIVVELDYVRHAGGPVVATSITYFGYVGVLTGVRKGLSMSLNFRPRHDCSTRGKEVRFRLQQLLVMLGVRQSISSVLRRYLLMPEEELELILRDGRKPGISGRKARKTSIASSDSMKPEIDASIVRGILEELSSSASTSCYLVFCTPQTVYSVQKDHHAAYIRESDIFLTTYNHDAADETEPASGSLAKTAQNLGAAEGQVTGMETLVSFSCDRKRHLDKVLRKRLERRRKKYLGRPDVAIGTDDLLTMVKDPWISNEESHYAVIMDPTAGKVLWRRLYDAGELT